MKLKEALVLGEYYVEVKTRKGRSYRVEISRITQGKDGLFGLDKNSNRSFSGNTEVVVRKVPTYDITVTENEFGLWRNAQN